MPREQDVIYCTMIDEHGRILSTSMIMKSQADHALREAENLFRVKGDVTHGIS